MALQPALNAGEEIPVKYATALLLGTWKGSTCKGGVGVEVTYTDVLPTTEKALHLRGVLRAVDLSKPSSAPAFTVDLDSYFSLNRGFLAAKSIAKPISPPTPEESAQETRLQQQESLAYAALARKRQDLATKQYLEKKDRVIQEYQAQDKALAEQMESLRAQQAQRIAAQSAKVAAAKAAAQAALVLVQFDVARDAQGKGWVGSVEGVVGGLARALDRKDDGGCHDLTLTSDAGVTTDKLPPVTGELALLRARSVGYFAWTPTSWKYWLDLAQSLGNSKVNLYLGEYYEKQAKDDARALGYYRLAADKEHDVRAQEALGRMYTQGLGTAKDLQQAQYWNSLAAATHLAATKTCTSPQAITALYAILRDEKRQALGMEMLGAAMTGIQVNSGNVRTLKVDAVNLISMDQPFVCKVIGKRVNVSVDASAVPDDYEGYDQFGREVEISNAGEKATKTLAAGIAQKALDGAPYVDGFKIEPLGDRRYKISSNVIKPPYAQMVDLRSP